ncbi:transposase [Streptomyces sp. NPDC002884]|uniref:transposase n=1 Tax=Streptomyces sp. NPDC002884 TaxID=3154544 RepID=UPI00332D13CD
MRLVRSLPEPEIGEVEILGVDDFAFGKGRHYGTVLIDMATHRPLHIYDGRDGEDLAAWLRDHPEVRVICRDRSSGYEEGARVGAPQAEQVADRYHLWANLGQAVEKTVNAHRSHLTEPPPGSVSGPDLVEVEPEVVQPPKELKIVIRLREQHAAAHELWQQGMSKAAIGRKLGLHQATVRKLVNARSADDVVAKNLQRAHVVDPYVGYLHRRWNEGVRNAAQLYREIKQLGYSCGELAVQRHLRRYRTGRGHAPDPGPKPPSVREVTSWIMTHPEHLRDEDADNLHRLRERDPELDRLTLHVRKFAAMMTGRHGDRLEDWIIDVEQDSLAPLAGFARNLRRDFDAVRNGQVVASASRLDRAAPPPASGRTTPARHPRRRLPAEDHRCRTPPGRSPLRAQARHPTSPGRRLRRQSRHPQQRAQRRPTRPPRSRNHPASRPDPLRHRRRTAGIHRPNTPTG